MSNEGQSAPRMTEPTMAGSAARLEQARQLIGDDLSAGGFTAVEALERYGAWVDAELRRIDAAAPPVASAALVALGGYGRRHLCPYSDIDLLIVFGNTVGADEERLLRAVLHPLWDAGFVVGHQVREIDELADPDVTNPEFLVALADARLIAGDEVLFEQMSLAYAKPNTRAATLDGLLGLTDARHARIQRHALSARTRREGSAGRPARRRGHPDHRRGHRADPCSGRGAATRRISPRRKPSCCASARCCTSNGAATTTCSGHELQEQARRTPRLSRARLRAGRSKR